MQMNIYTVYDTETKIYQPPFFQRHDVQALRAFKQAIATKQDGNAMHTDPQAFRLIRIGTWDEATAEIKETGQTVIANGDDHRPE